MPGLRRHLVTLQQATEAQNSEGEPVPTWSRIADAWVRIEPLGSRELEVVSQTYGEVSHRLSGPYTDLRQAAPKMRVIRGPIDGAGEPVVSAGARQFEIEGVVNVEERDREMQLYCVEHI